MDEFYILYFLKMIFIINRLIIGLITSVKENVYVLRMKLVVNTFIDFSLCFFVCKYIIESKEIIKFLKFSDDFILKQMQCKVRGGVGYN